MRSTEKLQPITIFLVLMLGYCQHLSAHELFTIKYAIPKTDTLIEDDDFKNKISYSLISSQDFGERDDRRVWKNTGYRDFYGFTDGLKKGEGYYQNIMLFGNSIRYGLSDNFSLGLTFETVSFFFFRSNIRVPVFSLSPKFSWPIIENKVKLSIGSLIIGVPNTGKLIDVGIVYGIATLGTEKANLSLGTGVIPTRGISTENEQLLIISGSLQLGKRSFLTMDNFFIRVTDDAGMHNILSIKFIVLNNCEFTASVVGLGEFPVKRDGSTFYETLPVPLFSFIFPLSKG
ncbi:MAG: hypothetical protein AB8F74_05640 [Saprospiraceae bacterium]